MIDSFHRQCLAPRVGERAKDNAGVPLMILDAARDAIHSACSRCCPCGDAFFSPSLPTCSLVDTAGGRGSGGSRHGPLTGDPIVILRNQLGPISLIAGRT